MKILVDKMPKTPKECMFSERLRGIEERYCCTLLPYIKDCDKKGSCLCKDTKECDRLKVHTCTVY